MLLLLPVLLPGIAAAAWAIAHVYEAEHQALEHRLGDTARALSTGIDSTLIRHRTPATDELQAIVDRQVVPAGWVAAVIDPAGVVVARQPHDAPAALGSTPVGVAEQHAGQHAGLFESETFTGRPVMAYLVTSPQGWGAVAAMPRSEFTGAMTSAVWPVVFGALALLALAAGGLRWASTRRTAGPASTDRPAEPDSTDPGRVEALGRLTGGVVHDFNNLLGVISNSAHLIQRQAAGPELQAPVAATLRAVEAGSRLTQQLMRFASRQPAAPHAVDLSSTLAEADEFLKAIAGKRIEVSVAVAPATRSVMVDESALELALTTLTLNARDAMPSGGRLRLQACNAVAADTTGLPAGDYVLITAGDDGSIGAPDGTPVSGLQQLHAFCVRSGGTSRLASTPGLGTTVSMLLPAC